MDALRSPRPPLLKTAAWLLRAYLAITLSGCATTRQLSVEEIHQLETRSYACSYETAFEAAKMCLQDLGYTIQQADYTGGTISGHQQTNDELGRITSVEEDEGLPTWAIVLIVVTGIVVIAGLIALLSSNDDDANEEANVHDEDDDSDGGWWLGLFDSPDVVEPDEGPTYHYEITLNLTTLEEQVTQLRISARGLKLDEGELKEVGQVYDKDFHAHFFAAMEEALRLEEAR